MRKAKEKKKKTPLKVATNGWRKVDITEANLYS